jgi:murein DD-endopeptidase MepM/ murein hydrolase activator NlpD
MIGPPVNRALDTAGALGRAALGGLGAMAGRLRDEVPGAAFTNLRLSVAVLLTGVGLVAAAAAVPVVLIVFALDAGLTNGLPIGGPGSFPPGPPLAPGELLCPLPGAVETQPFGPSDLSGEPAMFGYPHFHTGIDLARPQGTPILAAEAGEVIQAAGQTDALGFLVGYGNLVRIQADSARVDYYGHLLAFAVQRGDIVQPGQVIGLVGSTGYSTGPHVHFEVREGGTPVDPAAAMRPC